MSFEENNIICENGFIDGVFDGLHMGHIHALFQAKQKCNILHASSHLDKEIVKYKNKNTIFTYNYRYFLLKHCKFIDILHDHTPYNTDIHVLEKFNCDIFFHGDDNIDKTPLLELNEANKLSIYNRTSGISTTNLIERIKEYQENKKVKTNKDIIYLKYLYDKINAHDNLTNSSKNIIILTCNWDYFNINHIDLINLIKQKYHDSKICINLITDNTEYSIYNKNETAITLLGIKNIDNVILYDNEFFNKIFDDKTIDIILIGGYNKIIPLEISNIFHDNSFDKVINNLENLKIKLINSVDTSKYKIKTIPNKSHLLPAYNDILKSQFKNILNYIENLVFNVNDIIIFDIDEVCLCNLMYHDIEAYTNDDKYNYDNGMIPIISACKKLFKHIHKHSIKYSFITGRKDYIRNITIENLSNVKLDNYIDLYTCKNNYIGNMYNYKEKCR